MQQGDDPEKFGTEELRSSKLGVNSSSREVWDREVRLRSTRDDVESTRGLQRVFSVVEGTQRKDRFHTSTSISFGLDEDFVRDERCRMWKGVVSPVPLFCKSGYSDVERKYLCDVRQASLGCVEA